MSGHFKIKSVTDMKAVKKGDSIQESDFSLFTADDKFIQWEYVSEDSTAIVTYPIKAGIFTIAMQNQTMVLKQSGFTSNGLLEEYTATKEISDKIDTFFRKLDIYERYDMFPKRAMLLYGSAGAGKSVTVAKVCNQYAKSSDTTIVIWPSDKFEARHVKDFLKRFDYETNGIKKLFLIIEDLGGIENADGGRRYSESSLLSLLDNVEKTFTIPTMIIATTNYPENFLENLTNRPQRFDDVMEVKRPSAEFRAKFLEFFSQGGATDSAKHMIKDRKFDSLSVAHVKEIVIRAALYDITMEEAMLQILAQSTKASKGFTNAKSMGIGLGFNDE
jgi:ATP-dependent 26S proteasome regulatory subunit